MMNIQQKGIITLIKNAIDNRKYPLPEGFSIEAAESIAIQHHIVGIIYEGALLCGVDKNDPVMQRLFLKYYQMVVRNEMQMTALKQLFDVFDEHGIDHLPVKGSDMKLLYPNPAMRPMGDADVLIRMEQYERIKPIMEQLGYTSGHEIDHEIVWDSKALHLELHKRLIPTENKDYYAYMGDGWQFAKPVRGNRYTLPNEVMFVFLLLHFAKHYRGGGIGVRHAIDLWLYEQKIPMDAVALKAELEKVNMVDFYENIHAMLECWFEDRAWDAKAEFISAFLFSSGSWGTSKNKLLGQNLRSNKMNGNAGNSRIKLFFAALFPPLKTMQNRYAVLRKHAWLMPLFWPVRWFDAIFNRHENIRSYAKNIQTVSEENIDSFEKSLQYVGLYYDV